MPAPPWAMWGNSIPVEIIVPPPPRFLSGATSQLIRASYHRPETWRFLFGIEVTDCTDPGGTGLFQANFNLTIGIGRSRIQLPGFRPFTKAALPIAGQVFWANTGVDRLPDATTDNLIDTIVAQDIQLDCNVVLGQTVNTGVRIQVQTHAYFSPNVHMRPDWFVRTFAGGELGGQ